MRKKVFLCFTVLLCAVTINVLAVSGVSAAAIDLKSIDAWEKVNEAWFGTPESLLDQVSGSGLIDPFLRVQDKPDEYGYNVDVANATQFEFDEIHGSFTHSITVGDLQNAIVTGPGDVDYYEFFLDLGEPVGGGQNLISLNELEIYLAGTGSRSVAGDGTVTGLDYASEKMGALIYDLGDDEFGNENYIDLDYNTFGSGNGRLDMVAYIPTDLFGDDFDQNVVFYSAFGTPNNSEGTFEEWSHGTGAAPVPEPATIFLSGLGLLSMGTYLRKRKTKKA